MTERDTMTTRHGQSPPPSSGAPDPDPSRSIPADLLAPAAPPPSESAVIGSAEPAAISVLDEDSSLAKAAPLAGGGKVRIGDRLFLALTAGSGGFVVVLIALVAVFLITRAAPVIAQDHSNFLFSRGFDVGSAPLNFGVADLLWVTVITSVIALVLAVPVSIGIALFITQYAPLSLRRPIGYVIDLLAAVPSIIYGIWGIYVLAPHLAVVQRALYHLGWIPLFQDKNVATGSIFDAGVVLAVMILPIVTAISRDVFDRTPRANIEAAWALGATRWEMIRMAVLPFGRPGVISGAMLGLGRALGETIAVMLILSKPAQSAPFSFSIFDGGQTFASLIGLNMQEAAGKTETGAYIAAGLVLFVLTFVVNAAARAVVARRREFT
jgi:phosphate transport system permease protein